MIKSMRLKIELLPEAVVQSCSIKKLLLKISQNSQKNTSARVLKLNFVNFPVNFAKFLRSPFFTEHLGWPLL